MAAIGYARVSTTGQSPAVQQDAHSEAGCARVFTDTASDAQIARSLGVGPGTVYQHLDQNAAAR